MVIANWLIVQSVAAARMKWLRPTAEVPKLTLDLGKEIGLKSGYGPYQAYHVVPS